MQDVISLLKNCYISATQLFERLANFFVSTWWWESCLAWIRTMTKWSRVT